MNNNKRDKIIVLSIAALALGFFGMFMYSQFAPKTNQNPNIRRVVVSETGEASNINFNIPRNRNIKDTISLTEKYERLKLDSLKRLKLERDGISLTNATMTQGSIGDNADLDNNANSKLFGTPKPIVTDRVDPYQNSSKWLQNKNNKNNNSRQPVRNNVEPNKPELTYEQRVLLEREERRKRRLTQSTISSESPKTNSNKKIKASVFRNQFLIPGERLTLMIQEDIALNNKIFKKGTRIYAMISIKENRVLFDINNIAHEPVKLQVWDIVDGRKGMYSFRAGVLWKDYQDKSIEEANNQAINNIPNGGLAGGIVKGSVEALRNFFKRKRLREKDKIPFINASQVLLEILN